MKKAPASMPGPKKSHTRQLYHQDLAATQPRARERTAATFSYNAAFDGNKKVERYVVGLLILAAIIIFLGLTIFSSADRKNIRRKRRWLANMKRWTKPESHFLIKIENLDSLNIYAPCDPIIELLNDNFTGTWDDAIPTMNLGDTNTVVFPLATHKGDHSEIPGMTLSKAVMGRNISYNYRDLMKRRVAFFQAVVEGRYTQSGSQPWTVHKALPAEHVGRSSTSLGAELDQLADEALDREIDGERVFAESPGAKRKRLAIESRNAERAHHQASSSGSTDQNLTEDEDNAPQIDEKDVLAIEKQWTTRDGTAAFARLGWKQPPDWCELRESHDTTAVQRCLGRPQIERLFNDPTPFKVKSEEGVSDPYSRLADCPLIQKVECQTSSPVLTTEGPVAAGNGIPFGPRKRKGRALVLYMMHLWSGEHRLAEWGNFGFFWEFGVLADGQETELFDGVDYVFYRISKSNTDVEMCSEHGNVKFLWVPPGPCDLCGHARVLRFLGYDNETSGIDSWPYKSVVFMNSGVRGPFLHKKSSSWVDLVSVGRTDDMTFATEVEDGFGEGGPRTPNGRQQSFDLTDFTRFRTVWAVSLNLGGVGGDSHSSLNLKPHAQSYFLVIPAGILAEYYARFDASCGRGLVGFVFSSIKDISARFEEMVITKRKEGCIEKAEIRTLSIALENNFDVYFSLLQTSIYNASGVDAWERLSQQRHLPISTFNPTVVYNDPCKALFVKFGGDVMKEGSLPKKTMKAVNRLTSYFRSGKAPMGTRDSNTRSVVKEVHLGAQADRRSNIYVTATHARR